MSGGRKGQHRIAWRRRPPQQDAIIPITHRELNPALGYQRDGSPRTEAIRNCRVRVLSVGIQTLAEATGDDARREGYSGLAELLAAWGDPERPEAVRTWVIRWEVVPEEVRRYLSREVVAGRQGDYTEVQARGLPREPEAVDSDTLERYARDARERAEERDLDHRRKLEELPLERELKVLEAEARNRHIDVRDEVRALRRWTDPAARERQLERLRSKVWARAAVASGGIG